MKKSINRSALLEIGVEELPARFISSALEQLKNLMIEQLQKVDLPFESVRVFGTPRRLAVIISGLEQKSQDRVEEVAGPPPKAAKTPTGEWTQAATGFAKAQKMNVSALILKKTSKGERYVALHQIKGLKTDAALKEIFPAVISSLRFPKTMVWEPSKFKFPRPIRWLVSLYNKKVIRFKLAGVTADKTTIGLFSLGAKKISISSPESYQSTLQGRCIILDIEDRKKKIEEQIEAASKKIKATAIVEPSHLEEVANLTEYPTSLVGNFPHDYLKVPKEVLISSMRNHQKFFPLENSKKELINSFIGVRNGPSESQETVREGYERVLNARLADAKFFYEQDLKTPLEKFAGRLHEVGFHPKVGNLLEKADRVQKLVRHLGMKLSISETDIQNAEKVALLAKADLLTQMVGEFPELQGVAGRFYALAQGIDSEIAKAIEKHYWPLTAEGALPKSDLASLVSVADKIDTLAANFYVGQAPTGSADPYGLRRQGIGLLRILAQRDWPFPLDLLVDLSFDNAGWAGEERAQKQRDLREFMRQRCVGWLLNQGYQPDEIEAVLSVQGDSIGIILEKLKGLKAVRGREEFTHLAAAIKRAQNIINQAKTKGILPPQDGIDSEDDLEDESEKSLFLAVQGITPRVKAALKNRNYQEALMELAPLKGPVDQFFEKVMVMVENEKIRAQRLSILMSVSSLFHLIADFSKLQSTH